MPIPFLLRLAVFALMAFGLAAALHVLIYRRLVANLTSRPRLRITAAGLLATLLIGAVLVRAVASRFPFPRSQGLSLFVSAWLGVALYLGMALLVLEPLRRWALRRVEDPTNSPLSLQRREAIKQLTAAAALTAGGATSAFGLYHALAPPEVVDIQIALPNLPRALDGFTLVQLSDLHVGPLLQEHFLRMLVGKVNALRPDLVAITGDLVDGSVRKLSRTVAELQKLSSRHGTHFITGNHDYYSGADAWCQALGEMGMVVLRNRRVSIGDSGANFDLLGVDDISADRLGEKGYDLDAAMQGWRDDRASVLLAHQPRGFEEAAARGIGLQLSGHTHGGQMFPGTVLSDLIWGDASHGLSRRGSSSLFVSRGCGFVGPPMRVGSPPEIVRVILIHS